MFVFLCVKATKRQSDKAKRASLSFECPPHNTALPRLKISHPVAAGAIADVGGAGGAIGADVAKFALCLSIDAAMIEWPP